MQYISLALLLTIVVEIGSRSQEEFNDWYSKFVISVGWQERKRKDMEG